MFRLLIAEDDPAILDNLHNHFDWESLGFTVCGAVISGTDALHALALLRPDVLLTDMEMPGFSGLDIMEKIAAEQSSVKVVFLSAYDDYNYVRPALRLGAFDYLLKPVREEKLRELFLALADTIRDEENARQENACETYYLELSRQTAYSHILLQYLLGNYTDPKMLQLTMEHFGFQDDTMLTMASVQAQNLVENGKIPEILHRFYPSGEIRPVFLLYQKQAVFFLPDPGPSLPVFLTTLIPSETDYRCILTETAAFSTLPALFQTIHTNRSIWFYLPQNQFLPTLQKEVKEASENLVFPKANTVCDLIKCGKTGILEALLNSFLEECRVQKINPDTLTIHMADIYSNVVDQLRMVQPKLTAVNFEELYHMLQKSPHLDAFRNCLTGQLRTLSDSYTALCAAKGDLIDKVQDYIHKHAAEDISLGGLADVFYVTPAYLSSLFSRRTGETITAYLQNIRLDRAASLLLDSPQPVAKIGASVGYPNYSHFCRMFKRRFHVTPSDYRDLHRP